MTDRDVINSLRAALGFDPKENEKEKGIRCLEEDFYWAFPDGIDDHHSGWTVMYEVEGGQQHPCTNVLKYWPVLEQDAVLKIRLVHYLVKRPKSRNRWELSKFLGNKMMNAFPDRFDYTFLEIDAAENASKLHALKLLLA